MILHTWVDHDPRRTSIDFWVNRSNFKVNLGLINFVPFPHNNSITFWHTIMILLTCVDHDQWRTSIDFGVNRSKVKVKIDFELCKTLHNKSITLLSFDLQWWYLSDTCCLWSEEQPYWFWCPRSNLESLNLLPRGVFVSFRTGFITYLLQVVWVHHTD